jgi:hypothetical protein
MRVRAEHLPPFNRARLELERTRRALNNNSAKAERNNIVASVYARHHAPRKIQGTVRGRARVVAAARKIQGAARRRLQAAAARAARAAARPDVTPDQLRDVFGDEVVRARQGDSPFTYIELLFVMGAGAAGVRLQEFMGAVPAEYRPAYTPHFPDQVPQVVELLAAPIRASNIWVPPRRGIPVAGGLPVVPERVVAGLSSLLSFALDPRVLAAMLFIVVMTVLVLLSRRVGVRFTGSRLPPTRPPLSPINSPLPDPMTPLPNPTNGIRPKYVIPCHLTGSKIVAKYPDIRVGDVVMMEGAPYALDQTSRGFRMIRLG